MAKEKTTTTTTGGETIRVRMTTTVASGTTAWEKYDPEQKNSYEVDAEQGRAWIRDRVAVEDTDEVPTTEEVRAQVEDERVPRASEVDPANLRGSAPEGAEGAALSVATVTTRGSATATDAPTPRTDETRAGAGTKSAAAAPPRKSGGGTRTRKAS